MSRFVILLHEMPSGQPRATHWDLMLERDGVLRTWALADEPAAGLEGDARQLPDHRLAYLTYEGPVSGERGHVTRWDSGVYRVEHESENELRIVLAGERTSLTASLTRRASDDHSWRVSLAAAPSRG